MTLVYYGEKPPETFNSAIFLAGPSPRSKDVKSWRPGAIEILQRSNYDGVVYIPEPRPDTEEDPHFDAIGWEDNYLNMSDIIMFWIPRDMATLPGLTTNVEWGRWESSGKVVLGTPPDAPHVRYVRYYAERHRVRIADTLEQTVLFAIEAVGIGAKRTNGERRVPLMIWNTNFFQKWYLNKKKSGAVLHHARLKWYSLFGREWGIPSQWMLQVHTLANEAMSLVDAEFLISTNPRYTVVTNQ